jgi:DNA replication and repair protein RecF
MLTLQELSLRNFRNYEDKKLAFRERVVGFCGPNGAGKTNLLDAIHYLCLTRTYFGRNDAGNVRFGEQGFRIQGQFSRQDHLFDVACILRENGKKEMQLNQDVYARFSRHVGQFPVVVVAPDDIRLITEGSEERRKMLDTILSQVDPEYLSQLILYTKIVQQRNSLLKQSAEQGRMDAELLAVLDGQLAGPAAFIHARRSTFLEHFFIEVRSMYAMISGSAETVSLVYQSQLHERDMATLLRASLEKDRYALRTTAGIHRDEIGICLDDQPFRQVASQGQRKSMLFALRLAEFNILCRYKGFPPLLLLDDVFEKLDAYRMHNLLYWACVQNTGQIFLTDTHGDRLRDALEKLNVAAQIEPLD